MSAKVGKLASVKYLGSKVAGMGTWSISGLTRDILEDTEFNDDVKTFMFGVADGGTIDFNGLYDPADTTQNIFLSLLLAGTVLATTMLQLFIDSTSYWAVSTGGQILITKAAAITMDKNGLGQISFSAKVSGTLYLV